VVVVVLEVEPGGVVVVLVGAHSQVVVLLVVVELVEPLGVVVVVVVVEAAAQRFSARDQDWVVADHTNLHCPVQPLCPGVVVVVVVVLEAAHWTPARRGCHSPVPSCLAASTQVPAANGRSRQPAVSIGGAWIRISSPVSLHWQSSGSRRWTRSLAQPPQARAVTRTP